MYNSLIGMYTIYPQLFEKLELPESIDKDVVINNILLKCGEFEILYAAPHFLADMIGVWSKCNKYKFDTIAATTTLKYNPIENYDRFEDYEENSEQRGNRTANDSNTGQSEKLVAGFETGKYVGSEKSTINEKGVSSEENIGNGKTSHNLHIHGNIGVTSSQDMIEQERRVADFSVYDTIANMFKQEFCIAIY